MICYQPCLGVETHFDRNRAAKKLRQYRKYGPRKTTEWLVAALASKGVQRATVLDIGGGVGVIACELLRIGSESATFAEASSAYLEAAKEETNRQGASARMRFFHGDFTGLAGEIPNADIVTVDRVICCYPDMQKLVSLSAAKASRLYGLVYPRDTWWVRVYFALYDWWLTIAPSDFRMFLHPTRDVDAIILPLGFRQIHKRETLIWQVVVYTRI